MDKFKEMFLSRIICDSYYGATPAYHIRYDIHHDFLRELFEDEEKLEQFAEEIKRDVLYKLGKCADIDKYCQNDNAIVKEILEKIRKENDENTQCNDHD